MIPRYITGNVSTSTGVIPAISTTLTLYDRWSTIKVRWAIGRHNYKVDPGLYAIGKPDENSPVYVSCNYKLTFDHLRKELHGEDAWLLILDTRGVNVWCAAGKGTFSTKELVKRIGLTGLEKVVNHRRIIVPQLGAVGISAHEVKEQTGFRVIYGPVRAADIRQFMHDGMKASKEMRTVEFPLWERLKLVPVELSYGKYYLLLVPAIFILISGLNRSGYSIDLAFSDGIRATLNLLVAYLGGIAITPILLPWVPFRRFSLKGLIVGWIATLILFYFHLTGQKILETISWFLMIGGLSLLFTAMNFTGCSTYTSLSGVQKEMKTALPMQIVMAGLGVIVWIISKFVTI